MRQLKYKILWFILPVIVVPLVAAGLISEHQSSERLTANAHQNLQTIAQGVMQSLDLGFARAKHDRTIIATSPEIQTYLAQLEFGLKLEAASTLENIRSFLSDFYKNSGGAYLAIRLLDEKGRSLAQAGPVKQTINDPEFFSRFAAIKAGHEADKMSPVRRLEGVNRPIISLGALVHGTFKSSSGDSYDRWAVLILDMDWSRVTGFLNSLKAGRTILVGGKGLVLSHPDENLITTARMDDRPLVKQALEAGDGSLVSGLMADGGVSYYTVAQPFSPDEYRTWALLLQVPAGQVLAQAVQMRNLIIIVSAISVLAALIGIFIVAGLITRPVKTLVQATERVAKGDLSARVDIHSQDELGQLSEAFNRMAEDLIVHIEELKETTAENERLTGELKFAAKLQDSIIPKESPRVGQFQLVGLTLPAKETGGDFFDFINLSDTDLGLTIADVSGKGLPAALFMLLSRSTLRTLASEGHPPDKVLTEANTLIECDSGASGMFVTTFFARLEGDTGRFTYANGGHNPPVVVRADGRVEELGRTGLALGLMPLNECTAETIDLGQGDVLVLYTDGVTEAINTAQEEFGVPRFIETITENRTLPPAELIARIKDTVFQFAGDEPQFDDFTLMVIRCEGECTK